MAILILVSLLNGVYLWTFSVQVSMNQLDRDRMDEGVKVYATFGFIGTDVDVKVRVENIGPIDVNLVGMWLVTSDDEHHVFAEFSSPIPIRAGRYIDVERDPYVNELVRTVGVDVRSDSSFNYRFRVITERGNIAAARLVSEHLAGTNHPMVVIPELSSVTQEGEVHLVVWNSLEDHQSVSLMIVEVNTTQFSLPLPEIAVPPGMVTDFPVYSVGENLPKGTKVCVELVNKEGLIVSSCYPSVV